MSNMLMLFISCLWHANQEAVRGVAFLDRVGFAGRGRTQMLVWVSQLPEFAV